MYTLAYKAEMKREKNMCNMWCIDVYVNNAKMNAYRWENAHLKRDLHASFKIERKKTSIDYSLLYDFTCVCVVLLSMSYVIVHQGQDEKKTIANDIYVVTLA